MSTNQTFRTMGWQRTHTHTELSGRAVNIYFVHHAEVIRCEHNKMVYYFHVGRIQNLLQMIMAQGFPAWAEEGISRAAAETTANFKSISSEQVTIDVRM